METTSSMQRNLFAWIIYIIVIYWGRPCVAGVETVLRKVGENATLECPELLAGEVHGSGEWRHNGQVLATKSTSGSVGLAGNPINDKVTIIESNMTLIIPEVSRALEGSYNCSMDVTVNGNVSTKFNEYNLVVQDIPDRPKKPKVTNVTSSQVVVSWEASNSNNSPITSYELGVNECQASLLKTVPVLSDVRVHTIGDLDPFTCYTISVTAVNAIGNSIPSPASDEFYTEQDDSSTSRFPMSVPGNFSAIPFKNEIKLMWEKPKAKWNEEVLGYEIKYGRSPDQMEVFRVKDPDSTTTTLEGRQSYTMYTVSICVYNSVGKGPEIAMEVQTKDGVSSVPQITHISNNQATSFYVHWESPKTINGKLIKYKIRWKEGHSSSSKSREIVGHLTNPMTAYINDLKPYLDYKVQVAAATKGGYGDFTPEYPALTEVTAPSAPRNLNLTLKTETSVHLKWDRPLVVHKGVDFYLIHAWDHRGDELKEKIPGTYTEYTIRRLRTDARYYVKIAGITKAVFSNASLKGDFSQAIRFELGDSDKVISIIEFDNGIEDWTKKESGGTKHESGVPSVPRITHISNNQATSFYVHWESPKTINDKLIKYKIRWKEGHSSSSKSREIVGHLTNPMTVYINDLKPYSSYLVQVAAATRHGYGDFSPEYPALTEVAAPSAPLNLRVTPKNETSVHLEWDIPLMVYGRLDNYLVNFRDRSGDRVRITIPGGNLTEHTLTTTELRPLEFYDVKLAGITKSISTDTAYVGDFSQSVRTVLGDTSSLLLNLYEKMDILEQRFNQASNEAANSVVFYASLIENAFVEEGRAILFDDAMVNQGNAYHEETGVFTAPVHGVYAFQLSARLFGKDGEVVLAIVVRDTAEAKLRLDTDSGEQGTMSKVVSLWQGDKVKVVPTSVKNRSEEGWSLSLYYNQYTTFSGHMIKRD